jgi:hypothetical protein
MRSDLELLKLLLSELNSGRDFSGLCYLVKWTFTFTLEEARRLLRIIEANKPNSGKFDGYYWREYDVAPRRAFLEQLISELEAKS